MESGAVAAPDLHQTIETVWRMEAAKIIAALTRLVRDVGLAEELAQDALVAALEQWPTEGTPRNPAAWLMATARHRALDRLRRQPMLNRRHEQLGYEIETGRRDEAAALDDALDDDVGDDLLRLVFTACHPVLSKEAQVALTLRLLCGLTTDEIARAFLVPEPTIAQRIVRAKKTLARARVPFEVPRGDDLEARLASVLAVVYLVFNEGYTATAGTDWMRPTLCQEALRLARVLSELVPHEAEAHGLAALLEFQSSRLSARIDARGRAMRLHEQDRSRWDRLLIRRGLRALERAQQTTASPGPYALQAGIAACHATARTPGDTNWPAIVTLYDHLVRVMPSPVVELNRAVAVSMAMGPQAGLDVIEALARVPALKAYHLLPAVRGDCLERLQRFDEARREFRRAASLAVNDRERELLLERAENAAVGAAAARANG
jgi:RNA polymerase sigma factor (sigma-70 family)